jgi:hypothetical protein
VFFIVLFCSAGYAQFPVLPSTPQPYSFPNYSNSHRVNPSPQPNIPINNHNRIQEQNARLMQEYQQIERKRQMMNQQQIQEAMNELEPRRGINIAVCKSVIPLPDFSSEPEAEHFHAALGEINKMLTGEIPMSIKDAVFLAENAYFGNRLSYKNYTDRIKEAAGLCRAKIRQQGLNPNDNEVLCMTLFHYMTDTLKLKLSGSELTLIHYPIKYDFEDFYGREDLSKLFVTKLMAENSGQCHNMPQFFMIMAEELGAKAHLSLSPQHSFVKMQDNRGYWHNLELTCGAIVNDQSYLNSGFIKAEALRNKIYLEPLTQQQTVAEVILDLASGYIRKYGYDNFIQQCADMALKYHPNSVRAHMVKANLNTVRAMYVIERTGVPSVEKLAECPQAYRMYQIMHDSYKVLDGSGYEEMPPDAYRNWLNRVNEEKAKPENQRSRFQLQQVIK